MSVLPGDSSPTVVHPLFGSPCDGIRIYAERLASARAAMGRPSPLLSPDVVWPRAIDGDVVHVHLTDRLVDADPRRWDQLVRSVERACVPLIVTLHDLPQRGEGAERQRRRAGATKAIAANANAVVVSSEHERSCAAELGIATTVVRHPILPPGGATLRVPRHRRLRSLTVAGFVHPGKGILELVERLGHVGGTDLDGWHLRLVGDVVDDHCDHLDRIVAASRRVGLPVVHTGRVDDRRWIRELATAGVAICPHRHVSASGSVLSWIAAGRRPLVSDTAFARELASERPEAVRIVDDSQWWPAIGEALNGVDHSICSPNGWRTPREAVEAFERVVAAVLSTSPRNELAS